MSVDADFEYMVLGPQSFGLAIQELRRRCGISQGDLAAASGLHRSYLSALEHGAYTQALLHVIEAYRALGAEVVVRSRRSRQET